MSKFLTKAPFGVQTKRFSSIGYHPGLDPTGSLRAYRIKVSPGDYDPEHFECAYKKYNKAGSLWKRKAETEEYSKQLGFKNNKVLQERRYFKSLGGPGSYDVADTIYKQKSSSVLKDVNFGHEPKFLPSGNNNPGPGTYTKDLVLLSSTNKKQLTNKPPFEWDGFVDRFKLPAKPWSQPPNIYTPIDTESMEALLAKVVSKRGPYELFTGPRDPSTIKNHFAPPQRCAPDKYYSWPNGLDYLLNHSSKKRCGALLKDKRFRKKSTVRMLINDLTTCYRDPSEPSPATYDIKIDSITKLKPTLHPFNDSVTIVRKGVRWSLQPGPGRYNAQHPRCKKSKNQSWVFKSRTERIEHKSELYGLFPE